MSKNTIGEISDKSRLDHSQNVSARDISDSVIIKIDNLVLHPTFRTFSSSRNNFCIPSLAVQEL